MKKLIMAVAIVCATVVANAATYSWGQYDSSVFASGTTDYVAGTAYLFDNSQTSTATLLEAFLAGDDISALAIAGADGVSDDGYVEGPEFTYNQHAAGETWDAYYAIFSDDGKLFISETYTTMAQATATEDIAFADVTAESMAAAMSASAGYSGAGWYESVPEPTSGLLLLLGMAGLALRRKQA